MVDLLSLALTHALMALAAWRLLLRGDLDADPRPMDPAADAFPAGPAEPAPLGPGPGAEAGVPRLPRLARGARDRA